MYNCPSLKGCPFASLRYSSLPFPNLTRPNPNSCSSTYGPLFMQNLFFPPFPCATFLSLQGCHTKSTFFLWKSLAANPLASVSLPFLVRLFSEVLRGRIVPFLFRGVGSCRDPFFLFFRSPIVTFGIHETQLHFFFFFSHICWAPDSLLSRPPCPPCVFFLSFFLTTKYVVLLRHQLEDRLHPFSPRLPGPSSVNLPAILPHKELYWS